MRAVAAAERAAMHPSGALFATHRRLSDGDGRRRSFCEALLSPGRIARRDSPWTTGKRSGMQATPARLTFTAQRNPVPRLGATALSARVRLTVTRRSPSPTSRAGWAFPLSRVFQPLSPVERSSFLVSTRHDSDSIWIDGVDQIVGKPPQGPPPRSPSDSPGSLGVSQNLVEGSFHFHEQVRTKA